MIAHFRVKIALFKHKAAGVIVRCVLYNDNNDILLIRCVDLAAVRAPSGD